MPNSLTVGGEGPVSDGLLASKRWQAYSSISLTVKARLFPTEIRALGVGLPVAILGGTPSAWHWHRGETRAQ
jgi:hypothetical protein